MDRLTILVRRLYKSVPPTKYFFKVPLVDRFMPLVGGIGRLAESPLEASQLCLESVCAILRSFTRTSSLHYNNMISMLYFTTKHQHEQYRVSSRQNRWLYCPLVPEGIIKFSVLPSGINIAILA